METELTFNGIIANAFTIGLKNFFPLLVNFILWILTIWIPYLNIGTTIGLVAIPISLSKGEIISPVEIFNSKYRKYMGEFFLIVGLNAMVIFAALIFLIIPAIVIGLSWSLGILLMIEKGLNPIEALMTSNKITYGHKWKMFFAYLVLPLPLLLFGYLMVLHLPVAIYLYFIYLIILIPVYLGCKAYIYGVLSGKA